MRKELKECFELTTENNEKLSIDIEYSNVKDNFTLTLSDPDNRGRMMYTTGLTEDMVIGIADFLQAHVKTAKERSQCKELVTA